MKNLKSGALRGCPPLEGVAEDRLGGLKTGAGAPHKLCLKYLYKLPALMYNYALDLYKYATTL